MVDTNITPDLFDNKNFDYVEYFDALFDILNDDNDDDGDGSNDIGGNAQAEKLENILDEYHQDFDFDYFDTNVDEEEMIIEDDMIIDPAAAAAPATDNKKFEEEHVLSQKLNQLSADDDQHQPSTKEHYSTSYDNQKRSLSTPTTPDIIPKKTRSVTDESDTQHEDSRLPAYLQSTNQFFDRILINYLMYNGLTTMTVEDLRQLAIFKHRIADIQLQKQLWEIYLKLGTGQLKIGDDEIGKISVDRRLWPKHVKKMIPSTIKDMISTNQTYDEHEICESLVHQTLKKFNRAIQYYEHQIDQKKSTLADSTNNDLLKIIQTLVRQHGIPPLQMQFDYKRRALEFTYDMEILEREFLRLNPTEYQIQLARRVYDLRSKYVEKIEKLIELKQRILCNKPTISMYPALLSPSAFTAASTAFHPMMMNYDNPVGGVGRPKYEKGIQENLTDSMIASIIEAEDNIHEYKQLFDEEMLHLSAYNKSNNGEQLTELIYRRLKIIDKSLKSKYNFQINYFVRTHYGDFKDQTNLSPVRFLPSLLIDTSLSLSSLYQFTDEQLKLLNRGPTYVSPCQMYAGNNTSDGSIKTMIEKQYGLLQHDLSILFTKLHLNPAQSMFISKELKQTFIDMFSISLPSSLQQRALYEKQLIQSIRQQLKANDLILRRTANQRNIFYLANRQDFEARAHAYMIKTDIFEMNEKIDSNNLHHIREYLTRIIQSMNSEFKLLFDTNKKDQLDLLIKMYIDIGKIQLPYLYFLPDPSSSSKTHTQNDLSLKPVVTGLQRSITTRLGQFLDRLLRSVIQRNAKPTTFLNGADFMRKFIHHTEEQRRLRPTTMFATIKILNYTTLVPHGIMLIALRDFLQENLFGLTVENISINRIINLTAIFLHNNRFYYDNKIYRFMKGAPDGFPLTETLSNIYIYQWERTLVREVSIDNEFYGRCKNQIFLTWNKTPDEFRQLVQSIMNTNAEESKFEVHINVDLKAYYLGAHIENLDGTLYTSVYHDRDLPKYTLPYVIGDAKAAHSHWLRSSLIQAARYCTSVYDFNHERIYLEITFLANGYSLEFVEQRIKHFFTNFDALSLRSSLDHSVYDKLRHRLFNFISEQHQHYRHNQELEKNNLRMEMTYLYQWGPKYQFNKKAKEILVKNLYPPSSKPASIVPQNKQVKFIFRTKQQYSLNALLSEQKPYHKLLSQKIITF